jgi:hypothetical protein
MNVAIPMILLFCHIIKVPDFSPDHSRTLMASTSAGVCPDTDTHLSLERKTPVDNFPPLTPLI